jgi:hypothetical protein
MRSRESRHLQSILHASPTERTAAAKDFEISPEFNGHQYAIFLLNVDAGIEHALMVQYLYAAYSLGGPHVPPRYRETVKRWQETILGIAKEEMGHLITVENVLRLLSGPLNLDREDFPYDAAFYPFDFTFERLTLGSLAKYIYTEMPAGWTTPPAKEVKKRAEKAERFRPLHSVHVLFERMIAVISDPALVPDEFFCPDTVGQQASWNEWGRGYAHGARGSELQRDEPGTPDLIIRTVDSRASAVDALRAIAEQGEAPTPEMLQRSHFTRFLHIYDEWSEILEEDPNFDPARPVVTNPIVLDTLSQKPGKLSMLSDHCNVITAPVTFYWGHLLNVRYRLLLSALMHALHVPVSLQSTTRPTARGDLISIIFSEMYKIRSLASVLVQLPVRSDTPPSKAAAGPPFQMPDTLEIPQRESDRWRWQRDMVIASQTILETLEKIDTDDGRRGYIAALKESDAELMQLMNRLIAKSEEPAEVLV